MTASPSTSDRPMLILDIRGVSKVFPVRRGPLKRVVGTIKAVDDVSFTVRRGEVLGLVGESGCGKTTIGRMTLRAIEPTAGEILFHTGDECVDLARLPNAGLRRMRHRMQMIFQDPYSSLNPRMTVANIVGEPLLVNRIASGEALRRRVAELLETVGLDPRYMGRYPHAFSGGQRQRIGIARAIALRPDLVVADEPVSALDVSVQAQILNLLRKLKDDQGLTYIFISHDLGVVEYLCDRVAVMYAARLVELAPTRTLFRAPAHPYVEALLAAVPTLDFSRPLVRGAVRGEVADPANRPSGCAYHPRCRYAREICRSETPALERIEGARGGEHLVACHFARELTLRGVGPPRATVRPAAAPSAR